MQSGPLSAYISVSLPGSRRGTRLYRDKEEDGSTMVPFLVIGGRGKELTLTPSACRGCERAKAGDGMPLSM